MKYVLSLTGMYYLFVIFVHKKKVLFTDDKNLETCLAIVQMMIIYADNYLCYL